QAVRDPESQLLALHDHSMPTRRCWEQNGVRSEAEFLEQRGFRGIALQEHGEVQLSEEALVNLVHLRITGEEDESPAACDLQEAADAIGGFGGELRRTRIRKVRRNVEHRLIRVIEV